MFENGQWQLMAPLKDYLDNRVPMVNGMMVTSRSQIYWVEYKGDSKHKK
jgi:hypothetical protein